MRTIIAGSRFVCNPLSVLPHIDSTPWTITTVISGAAQGVDFLGETWARERGIPVERYPADWKKHGRAAGPIRNRKMADIAEALVLVYLPDSRGSLSMLGEAQRRGLKIHKLELPKPPPIDRKANDHDHQE